MIVLRRLGGQLIALNPDLIERVEATPDTVVTMVDEKKFLIEESLEEVLRLITDYRAFIIARSRTMAVDEYDPTGRPTLHVVPDELVASPATLEVVRNDEMAGELLAEMAIEDPERDDEPGPDGYGAGLDSKGRYR